MRWLAKIACWGLAFVFIVAGVPKIFAPADFARVISMYGLLPGSFVYPAALILPLLELITATGLLFFRPWALLLAGGQLIIFIIVLAYGLFLGLDIDCGCFGPEDPEHDAVSSLGSALVRDLLLFIPLIYAWWFFAKTKIK